MATTDPYRTSEVKNPKPSKIVQIVSFNDLLVVLDDNGQVWSTTRTSSKGVAKKPGGLYIDHYIYPSESFHPWKLITGEPVDWK